MKHFIRYFFVFITASLILSSCGKDGAVGPTGPTGAAGAVGPAGPAGANGTNGSIIYSGTVNPASTVGAVGDFYINLSTGFLFGPKTSIGWGTGVSLKGAAGATGAKGATGSNGVAGSQIYSGSGAPAVSKGINGDYYLDITSYLLYGPKTAAGWGTPISLQGPEGNANVKTDVFTIGGSDWLWNSQYVYETSVGGYTEYFTRYYQRNNNTVTQDVLDNGLVLVYFTPSPVNNPNQWAPLPYQFDSSFGYTDNYVYVTSPGVVTLHYFFITTQTTATPPTLSTYNDINRKFKIVTVTGTTGTFMTQHHVNLNNYDEVSKVTGLWLQDKVQ